MKIAVACTADYSKVAGHAGRARRWLVFAEEDPPRQVQLSAKQVFHYFEGADAHPLDGVDVLIAQSAGEGFLGKMKRRGVDAVTTGETNPAKAASDYLGHRLAAPQPRPIGALVCKAIDMFSKHK